MAKDFLVSADGHYVEPTDLFTSRLPRHLRDLAVWEENFEVEPLGDDGYRHYRKLHTPGFEGWTYARYFHHDGTPQQGDPARIIEDLDHEGIWATLMHPNHALFGLYTHDHHELSMAHARVYTDYVTEVFAPYRDRVITTAPIPMTDIPDAVAEIERVAALGARAILLPAVAPQPYSARELDPVWAAAQAHGLLVAFHVATGGVLERFPDLHFLLVEFNAHWLVSAVAAMDKAWTVGVGQNRDWWIGIWDDGVPAAQQPEMAQLFHLNERWPYPLMPSEYVRRQVHVSFQEDPVAVACRHATGISPLVWGADYPHSEGTFLHTREAIDYQFKDVPDEERAAILGGTLGGLLGVKAPTPA